MRFVISTILLASPVLAQGVVADTSEGAVVRAEAQTLRASCGGGDALIEGNHNIIVLTGACRSLLLKGVANTVAIALRAGAAIRVEGSANRVSYQVPGADPAVETFGPDNLVSAGPSPAPPAPPSTVAPAPAPPAPAPPAPPAPPASLTLGGDDRSQVADCAGRDVAITGLRSAYVLRGGCKSLSVDGDLVTVQAEVTAGARITLHGRSSTVMWAIHGRGAPPAVTVRGEASRVLRTTTIGGVPVR